MPKAVYQEIFHKLREDIDSGALPYESLLPPESELTRRFGCSRSTIRRAIAELAAGGYVQPMQGRGVRVIHNREVENDVDHGYTGVETFKEMALRRGFVPSTTTVAFEQIVADTALAELTGFKEGSELTHVVRVRHANGSAVGTDESYYLASEVEGLTPEIVNNSIYEFLENERGMCIVTSKRAVSVEPVSEADRATIDLKGFNAIAVMRCHAYDNNAILVEYTETRQRPGFFALNDTTIRQRR